MPEMVAHNGSRTATFSTHGGSILPMVRIDDCNAEMRDAEATAPAQEDGSIARGDQNLPGSSGSSHFNLSGALRDLVPAIGKKPSTIMIHNARFTNIKANGRGD